MNNYEEAMIDRVLKFEAKVKELEAEIEKLKRTMRLHAGDCCSLNNEVELFRGHWEEAEERCKELENKNNELMAKCGHQAISINELKRELKNLN